MIESAVNFALNVIHNAPPMFWPLFLGWGVSAGLTQRVKFYMPLEWPSKLRAFIAQGVAFWTGALTVAGLWPDKYGVAAGVFVGIWSPVFYSVFVRVAIPQALRDSLSADVRENQ